MIRIVKASAILLAGLVLVTAADRGGEPLDAANSDKIELSSAALPVPVGLTPPSGVLDTHQVPDTHRVYVANEASDRVSRVAFVPGVGAWVEADIPVGLNPGDIDGAHGISVSPDGEYWYVTVAHGTPWGQVWQFHAGPDTLVAMTEVGLFPATMGLTPDGRFLFAVNFNLHGDMVPSNLSVVYTPEMREMAKVETCLMPHGSRLSADGRHQYSVCMHSDQLVQLDVGTFSVSGRYQVTPEHEGVVSPAEADAGPEKHSGARGQDGAGRDVSAPDASHNAGQDMPMSPSSAMPPPGATPCSPTWVEPGQGSGADRFVYIACNKNAEVLEVDVVSWEVTRRFPTGAGPYNLDITPDGRLLVVTLKNSQAIAVIDLESGEEAARLDASQPVTHGVVVDPEGRYAFVSNESVGAVPGTLDVFDLESLERVASVDLAFQSGGIDYWSGPGGR